MQGKATMISLTEEEQEQLESWVRAGTKEQRLVQRARIVLESAEGSKTREIARSLGLREATVSKWRLRFDIERVPGLTDAPRPGAQFKYDRNTERRILTALDNPTPEGYAKWSGKLLSKSRRYPRAEPVALGRARASLDARWANTHSPTGKARGTLPFGLFEGNRSGILSA